MGKQFTRRAMITTGLVASTAAAASVLFGKRYGLLPPDSGGLFGVGTTLTHATHRILLSRQPHARGFSRNQISTNFPAINTVLPEDQLYRQDIPTGFRRWKSMFKCNVYHQS